MTARTRSHRWRNSSLTGRGATAAGTPRTSLSKSLPEGLPALRDSRHLSTYSPNIGAKTVQNVDLSHVRSHHRHGGALVRGRPDHRQRRGDGVLAVQRVESQVGLCSKSTSLSATDRSPVKQPRRSSLPWVGCFDAAGSPSSATLSCGQETEDDVVLNCHVCVGVVSLVCEVLGRLPRSWCSVARKAHDARVTSDSGARYSSGKPRPMLFCMTSNVTSPVMCTSVWCPTCETYSVVCLVRASREASGRGSDTTMRFARCPRRSAAGRRRKRAPVRHGLQFRFRPRPLRPQTIQSCF